VTAQQRHAEHAAGTGDTRELAERVLGVGLDVWDVHRVPLGDDAAGERAAVQHLTDLAQGLHHFRRVAVARATRQLSVALHVDGNHRRIAQVRGRGDE